MENFQQKRLSGCNACINMRDKPILLHVSFMQALSFPSLLAGVTPSCLPPFMGVGKCSSSNLYINELHQQMPFLLEPLSGSGIFGVLLKTV